jgi:hypothetical protein
MAQLYTLKSSDEVLSPLRNYNGDDEYLQALAQRTYGVTGRNVENSNDIWSGIKSRLKSVENALGTTGSAIASLFNDKSQQTKTENMLKDNKSKLNSIAQKYGYQSYNDALNNSTYDDNSAMWDELRAQSSANVETANKNASDYQDYADNNYVSQKINQDRNKFAGSAINTESMLFDILAPGAGVAANTIQGGVEGIADELEQNGSDFSWDNALNRASSGALAGAVTGGLNKGLNSQLAKNNGQLFQGKNVLSKTANTINSKADSLLGKNQLLKGVSQGVQRGALSGAVGGATGAGVSSALAGNDAGTILSDALTGAGQGLQQGAVMGGTIGGTNTIAGRIAPKTMSKLSNAQGYQDWKNSGNDFNERLTNTLNSGDSTVGNWINNGGVQKTLDRLNNGALSIKNTAQPSSSDDVVANMNAYKNGEFTAEQAVQKYNNGEMSEWALVKIWDLSDDNNRNAINNLLEQSPRWQESVENSAIDANPQNNSVQIETVEEYVSPEIQRAMDESKANNYTNSQADAQSPTTLGEWTKKAAGRALDGINEKGVGLSIKDTSNNPETEVYRTLNQTTPDSETTVTQRTTQTTEPLLTSKEYEYRQKAAQALLDQYNTVDAPTSRATRPLETVQQIADAGFTKPQDVEKAIRAITGTSGKLNKLTQNVIQNAGEVNTMSKFIGSNGQEMEFGDYVKDVAEGAGLGKFGESGSKANDIVYQIQNKMNSLGSRRNGTITGTDPAEDVFDVIRDLEATSAEYKGKGGSTYHRATKEDLAKANVLDNVATQLKGRVFDASDVSKVVTPEALSDLKSIDPTNKQWAKYVDENIATAKTGQDLRAAQAPFVRMGKIIDNSIANSGTFGSTMAKRFKNGMSKNGLISAGIEAVADSPIAKRAEYKYYTDKANSEAAKTTAGNTVGNNSNTATSTQTPETEVYNTLTAKEYSTTPLLNAIGREVGKIEGNDTTNYHNDERSWNNALSDADQTLEGMASVYGATTLDDLVNGTSSYGTDTTSTGDSELDRLSRAMELALQAGDTDAFNELYETYAAASKVFGTQTSSQESLSSTQQRANAAMTALNELESLEPDLGYALSDIPLIGKIATWGGNTYDEAADSLIQQIAYMQSGANVKDDEVALIKSSYVPQPWDSEATRQQKLARARNLIQQYQNGYMTSEE